MSRNRIAVFTFFLMLIAFSASSQDIKIKGIIKDIETGIPLSGVSVILQDTTIVNNDDGTFEIDNLLQSKQIHISLIGYTDTIISINNNAQIFYTVLLSREYNTLPAVEIYSSYYINKTLDKVKAKVSENYVPADIPLAYDWHSYLYKNDDTVLDSYTPVCWKGRKNVFSKYELYKQKSVTLQINKNKMTPELSDDYLCPWNMLGSANDIYDILNHFDTSYFHIFVSTFKEDGDDYYDIMLFDKQPQKTKYDVAAKMMGYGKEKNNPNAGKEYMGMVNYQINKRTFALTLYQWINIAVNDSMKTSLAQAQNRNMLTQWLADAAQNHSSFCTFKVSYQYDTQFSKYVIGSWEIKDNLFNGAYRGKSTFGYTWQYGFKFKNVLEALPKDAKPLSIKWDIQLALH